MDKLWMSIDDGQNNSKHASLEMQATGQKKGIRDMTVKNEDM